MPTVTIGNNTGDDYSGTEDAQIQNGDPTGNYGASTFEAVGRGSSAIWSMLIRFTGIASLPSSIDVSDSSINVRSLTGSGSAYTGYSRRVLRAWIEGTQSGSNRTGDDPDSCCWSEYGSGNAWSTAGCLSDGNDRSASASASGTITNGYNEWSSLSGSGLNTDIENMASGSYDNNGWIITHDGSPASNEYSMLYFSEYNTGSRPYLTVTYTESGGSTENSYYYMMNQ